MMLDFPYLHSKYNIQSKGVLHIGAHLGQESELYSAYGIDKMIFIEAIPEIFEQLGKNIAKYPKAIALNACISDVDDEVKTFHISSNEGQSSSFLELGHHKKIHPDVSFVNEFTTRTKRVDTLLQQTGVDISDVNFLNIDLQGAELFALKGMGELLKDFTYIILEVNKKETYLGCALVEEIDAFLIPFGFQRVETGKWVGDTWTDAFYINTANQN